MRHIYQCQVRWGDMDALGHVNNVRFLEYMQEARVDMFWTSPRSAGEHVMEYDLVVARNEIDYLVPLIWSHEPLTVEVWVSELKNASFEVAYELKRGETVHASAKSVLVAFDLESQRPRRLDEKARTLLEKYFDATI
jgi:acyl-CoA thioester hydrolase